MQVEYQNGPEDVEAWWQFYAKRNSAHRVNLVALALSFAGFGTWLATRLASDLRSGIGFGAIGCAGGLVLAVVLWRGSIHSTVVSATSGPAGRAHFGFHRLTVGPEGVVEEGPAETHEHAWAAIEGVHETHDHLFLAVGGGYAYVLPKKGMTPSTVVEFKSAVTQHLAEEARRRTRG